MRRRLERDAQDDWRPRWRTMTRPRIKSGRDSLARPPNGQGSLLGFHQTDPRTGEGRRRADRRAATTRSNRRRRCRSNRRKDTGKDALQEEIAKLNELMDEYKELAKAKMKSLDDALAHQRSTIQQWLAATTDALEDEKQDVQAAYRPRSWRSPG